MSSQIPNSIVGELQKAYKAALLRIVDNLNIEQQQKLQFYYEGLIPREIDGALNILRSLEDVEEISWTDVDSLKKGLRAIQRLDLIEILTTFETRRDLNLFLVDYARKRQGSESWCYQSASSIELLAKHLVKVTTGIFTDGLNGSKVRSLMKSRKNVQEMLLDFEEQIEKKQFVNPWSKLTFLVVIAGEVVAAVFMMSAIDEERPTDPKEVLRICSKFCRTRLMKLGNWVSLQQYAMILISFQFFVRYISSIFPICKYSGEYSLLHRTFVFNYAKD